jgi:cytochrome c peroxidase
MRENPDGRFRKTPQRRARRAAGRVLAVLLLAAPALASAESLGDSAVRPFLDGYRRGAEPPHPATNAPTPARVELGKTLFFDPRLSASGVMSCGTCHNPALSWGDGLPRGVGHGMKTLSRRTPTILNVAWSELLFWDGRAASLEEQALGPITSPGEMNLSLEELASRVRGIAEYAPLFEAAYPGEPVAPETIAKAIACYERTVVSGRAPFDRWIEGDEDALSASAKRGFLLFNTKARCATCHSGWRFTDDAFHDIGVPGEDRGRGQHLPTIEIVQFGFKTPTLRNVDRRAPYMHDGSEATLASVIELYDQGGREKRPSLSREMKPLGLSKREKQDLVAFLGTLTSADAPVAIPSLPR